MRRGRITGAAVALLVFTCCALLQSAVADGEAVADGPQPEPDSTRIVAPQPEDVVVATTPPPPISFDPPAILVAKAAAGEDAVGLRGAVGGATVPEGVETPLTEAGPVPSARPMLDKHEGIVLHPPAVKVDEDIGAEGGEAPPVTVDAVPLDATATEQEQPTLHPTEVIDNTPFQLNSLTIGVGALLVAAGAYVWRRMKRMKPAEALPSLQAGGRSWETTAMSSLDARFPRLLGVPPTTTGTGPPFKSLLSDDHIRAILKHLPIRYTAVSVRYGNCSSVYMWFGVGTVLQLLSG